jgi:Domain of unknown function (DUF4258)
MAKIIPIQAMRPNRLSKDQFKAEIVKLVKQDAIRIVAHLRRDHPERKISPMDIKRCLEKGTVQTDPFVNQHGNWQAEMYRHLAGARLTVVAAIKWEERVIVITAY